MTCTETSNTSKFYGHFLRFFFYHSLVLSLFLAYKHKHTYTHTDMYTHILTLSFGRVKFTFVFARGVVIVCVFDESVVKVGRAALHVVSHIVSHRCCRIDVFSLTEQKLMPVIVWKLCKNITSIDKCKLFFCTIFFPKHQKFLYFSCIQFYLQLQYNFIVL